MNLPFIVMIWQPKYIAKILNRNKNQHLVFQFFMMKIIETNYKLLVNFPDRNKFILSSIIGMILLSIIFTSIIIIAYSSALYQLVKQRKISANKNRFY